MQCKIFRSKQEIREYVWKKLREEGVALFPNENHIPNFKGVEDTIKKILELDEYKKANKIFISPDTPQRILIKYAIKDGKEIYMATPKLRKGFCKVAIYSSSLREILNHAKILGWNVPKIDFALIGSVAVDLKGNRIGKGGGYGDREILFLRNINSKVIIATNVHDLQVFNDLSYLMESHDQKVDIIITPTRILKIKD